MIPASTEPGPLGLFDNEDCEKDSNSGFSGSIFALAGREGGGEVEIVFCIMRSLRGSLFR